MLGKRKLDDTEQAWLASETKDEAKKQKIEKDDKP